MKTEKEIQEKLEEIIKAHDVFDKLDVYRVDDYSLGMVDILEWVLDEEEDE